MPSLKLPSFKSKPTPALQPSADTAQLYPTNQGYRESASATTRFFRNYPQLLALARTVSTVWPGGTKLDVLHIGGSWGCEALSFQIVMREQQPSFQLETVSTDLDDAIIVPARRMEYSGEFFQPLRENEGGNPNNLREKWFDVLRVAGPRVYRPKAVLARSIRFQTLDIRQPPAALTADIVFCQNVLVHMEDELAKRCLNNILRLLRTPAILVCAGMKLDLKAILAQAGLVPVTDSIQEVHDMWSSQRVHYQENPGKIYFELEDLDRTRPDWEVRYSTIFIKQ